MGASAKGVVRVGGAEHPMPQHGFARRLPFRTGERDAATARLELTESEETLAHYPFRFRLEVTATLSPTTLRLAFAVTYTGRNGSMPYGLGFHPAFPWPLDGTAREGHRVLFEAPERPDVPEVAPGGLLARRTRTVPLDGSVLPLSPDLFTEALVFLDARSRTFRFEAPSGAAIAMRMEGFPHLAVWSKPTAPFLSLEAWSAHADWEDAAGELAERPAMIHLQPGETAHHAVTLTATPPGGHETTASGR